MVILYRKILLAALIMIITSLVLRGCKDHLTLLGSNYSNSVTVVKDSVVCLTAYNIL